MRQMIGAFLSLAGVCVGLKVCIYLMNSGLQKFFTESLNNPYDPVVMANAATTVFMGIPGGLVIGSLIVTVGLFIYDTSGGGDNAAR